MRVLHSIVSEPFRKIGSTIELFSLEILLFPNGKWKRKKRWADNGMYEAHNGTNSRHTWNCVDVKNAKRSRKMSFCGDFFSLSFSDIHFIQFPVAIFFPVAESCDECTNNGQVENYLVIENLALIFHSIRCANKNAFIAQLVCVCVCGDEWANDVNGKWSNEQKWLNVMCEMSRWRKRWEWRRCRHWIHTMTAEMHCTLICHARFLGFSVGMASFVLSSSLANSSPLFSQRINAISRQWHILIQQNHRNHNADNRPKRKRTENPLILFDLDWVTIYAPKMNDDEQRNDALDLFEISSAFTSLSALWFHKVLFYYCHRALRSLANRSMIWFGRCRCHSCFLPFVVSHWVRFNGSDDLTHTVIANRCNSLAIYTFSI